MGFTRRQACTPRLHPREPVSTALRREIITSYGYDRTKFRGEIDHRVPVFLLGHSNRQNLWPETAAIPNPK